MAVIKRDGKLFVDAFDGTGENIVTADQPISESGRARKGGLAVLFLNEPFKCQFSVLYS